MRNKLRFTAFTAVVLVTACGGKKKILSGPESESSPMVRTIEQALVLQADAKSGLTMRLRAAKSKSAGSDQARVAKGRELSAADTKRLLSRLPALAAPQGLAKPFALRKASRPAPRPGKTIRSRFPPAASSLLPKVTVATKLEVVRFSPRGKVALAPHLSVTFSQPMIPITSQGEAAKVVPVQLKPQPPGQWRWVGTRTLIFDPEVRMPQATRYQVHIPRTTTSAVNRNLQGDFDWTFETPPPKLVNRGPQGSSIGLEPVIYLLFDQSIDAERIAGAIRIEAGRQTIGARLASAEELAADKAASAFVEAHKDTPKRVVAIVARKKLPLDTNVRVVAPSGIPSLEGPLKTAKDQSFSFRTYGPLRVQNQSCRRTPCSPGQLWMQLSNPLDEEAIDLDEIEIRPPLAGRRVSIQHNNIHIDGLVKPRTTYTVTLPAALTDTYGQTLGKDTPVPFQIGPARPTLFGPSGLVVIDPAAAKPKINVYSVGQRSLDVQIYSVGPDNWAGWAKYMYRRGNKKPPAIPGKKVWAGKVKVKGGLDDLVETSIDLSPALQGGLGHAILIVEPSTWKKKSHYKPAVRTWVQSTKIGLDAFSDSNELIAWASSLADGTSMPGVKIEVRPTNVRASTGTDGTAHFDLPAKVGRGAGLIIARRGSDVAILPESLSWYSNSTNWRRIKHPDSLRWFVFDDRKMYRPGEEARIKGWIRRASGGEKTDIGRLGISAKTVTWELRDSRGNKIGKGSAKLSRAGGFDFAIKLPKTPNLGRARLSLKTRSGLNGSSHSHRFEIQEFRRPEFEVSMDASQGPFTIGDTAKLTTSAAYYAGGGLPDAPVRWSVVASETQFTPPNRRDYAFGTWTPWWTHQPGGEKNRLGLEARTDPSGKHRIDIEFVTAKPPRANKVRVEATVTDVNRQRWATSKELIVHPARVYVGLKRDRYFVSRGQPIELGVLVVDQEGVPAAKLPAKVEAVRVAYEYKNGSYQEVELEAQNCAVSGQGTCRFETPQGGVYKIKATAVDEKGRPTQTVIRTWVTGGQQPPSRKVEQESITLIPDKEDYAPGDTAKILVQAPFADGEGILTVRRRGILSSSRFRMRGTGHTLSVPVKDRLTPNLFVHVDLIGKSPRVDGRGRPIKDLPPRPAFARGTIELSIPPRHRTLSVKVAPRKKVIAPGGRTSVKLSVRDQSGRAIKGAEVAVVVVDEAVLALSNYENPDPIAGLYRKLISGGLDFHSRRYVKLATAADLGLAMSLELDHDADGILDVDDAKGGGWGRGSGRLGAVVLAEKTAVPPGEPAPAPPPPPPGGQGKAIAVRTNFSALAHFAGAVPTDSAGRATVNIRVPDNLTRYRIIAVATDGGPRFGTGESSLVAKLPLMVRPSPPRFLNYGDRFELPIVLQNQTNRPMPVRIALRSQNARLARSRGREVTVPANDRVEVRFPASAVKPGTARFQFAAASGGLSDGGMFEFPVWTPATTEAFASYGQIDAAGSIAQPVAKPPAVVNDFGGLEITTSSTQVQALTDAVLYLVRYPYECSEQISSRVLAIAALRDVLNAFRADGLPPAKELNASVGKDIKRLRDLQKWDGGFGFWTGYSSTWPYLSVHVAHALARAKAKGYRVPKVMTDKSLRYLRRIDSKIPASYSQEARDSITAYALYVRKHLGDGDPAAARKLIAKRGLKKLSLDATGWLLYSLSGSKGSAGTIKRIHRLLDNRSTETAGTATFATSMSNGAHLILHSSRRTDAIVLEALIESRPKSDLITKLVRGLLAHRKRGRWRSTQENAWVLLALDRYFEVYEKVTPNFVSRAWLGDRYAGDHRFSGRTTERHRIDIPMRELSGKPESLTLQKDGTGRMYYRVGMRYAPKSLRLKPADYGFAVTRRYEAIDDPKDVTRRRDGAWVIKAGARVRVRVSMVAESRRYHVALVDPIPAGLEAQNPALAVTGSLPQDPSAKRPTSWWQRTWYEHQNMRDERVEAFASLLWAGVHDYSYVATATTPGVFVVPPAKAEEMYAPETFGRSGTDRVIVR